MNIRSWFRGLRKQKEDPNKALLEELDRVNTLALRGKVCYTCAYWKCLCRSTLSGPLSGNCTYWGRERTQENGFCHQWKEAGVRLHN